MDQPATGMGVRWWPLLVGLVLVAAYFSLGAELDGFVEPGINRFVDLFSKPMLDSPRHPHPITMSGWLWKTFLLLPAALLLGYALGGIRFPVPEAWRAGNQRTWALAVSALGILLVLLTGTCVLDWTPLTDDETTYVFQARLLSSGRIQAPAPPASASFDNRFLLIGQTITGKYSFGHPALLVPGLLVGFAPLVPVLLAGATVWLTFLLGGELGIGAGTSLLAAFLLVLSPFFLTVSATLLSHGGTCFLLMASLLLFLRGCPGEPCRTPSSAAAADECCGAPRGSKAQKTGQRATCREENTWSGGFAGRLLAGLLFGWALNIRPLTALAWSLPLGWLLWRECRRLGWPALPMVLAVGTGVGTMVFLTGWYNLAVTGHPWTFPFQAYDAREHLGFGEIVSGYDHTPLRGLNNLLVALARYNLYLHGNPCGWLFPLGLLLFGTLAWPQRLLWSVVVTQCVVHIGYFTQGVGFSGPLYLYESLPLLMLLSAQGVVTFDAWFRERFAGRREMVRWFFAVSLFLAALTTVPERFLDLARVTDLEERPFRQIREMGLTRAVVFLHQMPRLGWRHGYAPNSPDFDDPVLFCWIGHGSQNAAVMAAFPGREYYLLTEKSGEYQLYKPPPEQLASWP